MKHSSVSSSFFSFFFLVFMLLATTTKSETFVECLNSHSDLSKPISQALYFPTNSSYSDILQFYRRNLRFNASTTSKPQFILTAKHASHIQATIICAKSYGLEMRIRSGGHDFEGLSYVSKSPFFILDLFNLRTINVNVEEETAWAEAGATLGELYYRISEKSKVHAFPGGTCPSVALGGHISSGGYGNLIRKYGLATDNVLDAIIVDVNGRVLNRTSMGEDLFWAITSGGGSSFGVILAYKVRLVRVPPKVTFARTRITYKNPLFTNIVYKHLKGVDKLNKDLYLKLALDVDENKTIRATFLILLLGNCETLIAHMNQSLPEAGLTNSDCVEVSWVESVVRWAGFPIGTPTSILLSRVLPALDSKKRKSDFLKNPISKAGLEFIFEKMEELETPVLKFSPFGGIMDEISPSAKPFPHRKGNIALVEIATDWNEPGLDADFYYVNITRKLYEYITPFMSKSREAYLGYRDIDLGINRNGPNSYSEAASYGIKYFKNNFEKLVEIKSRADPDNFFKDEQSIPVSPLIRTA